MPKSKPLLSTLNLQDKPKIGNTLNPQQISAIKNFYKHIQENLTPDEFGIYREASSQLAGLDIDLTTFEQQQALSEEQRLQLFMLYRQILFIYNDNKTDIIIPGTDQTKIMQACNTVIRTFSNSTPEFESYSRQRQLEHQHLTDLNAEEEAELQSRGVAQDVMLVLILRRALQRNEDYRLTTAQIKSIKEALGDDIFQIFIKRYNLNEEEMTLDDLRMLIIGVIGTANERILQSSFIHHLYYALDINEQNPTAQLQLTTKLSDSILDYKSQHAAIQRIKAAPPTSLLDKLVNFARSFIPEKWRSIISERLKVNANFQNDLDTSILASNVRNWQRDPTGLTLKQAKTEQRAASYEYLFHKIAYQDLADGTILPVVEPNGSIQYYKAYNLVNKDGFVSMALVPASPTQKNLDIKVLFRGTHSIGSAIVDAEKYGAGYKSFRNNEAEVFTKLNQIIGNVKQEAKAHGINPAISLTVGGHSLGGAETQNFYASIIKAKLLPLYNKYHGDHEKLREKIRPIIEQQVKYEIQVKYQSAVKYDTPEAINQLVDQRIAYLLKSLDKYHLKHQPLEIQRQTRKAKGKDEHSEEYSMQLQDDHLAQLSTINVATLNAAGAAYKSHDLAADGLALLQETNTEHKFNARFTNIMVGGDVVQQTGQTNVSAGLPPQYINVETVKINSGLEGKAQQQSLASAFEVVKGLAVKALGLKIPLPPNTPESGDISKIIDNIKKAHCDLHFDDPSKTVKYEYQSNQDRSALAQVRNLTTKVPIVQSETFQIAKKQLSWLKKAYSKLAAFLGKASEGSTAILGSIKHIDKLFNLDQTKAAVEHLQTAPITQLLGSKAHAMLSSQVASHLGGVDVNFQSLAQHVQGLATQALMPALADWQQTFKNLRRMLVDDDKWKIQLPTSTRTKAPHSFTIIPKTLDKVFQMANQIHVNYDPKAKSTKFHIKAATAADETILQMLINAKKCGEVLTLNGSPSLITKAIELAEQHNIHNIQVSARSMQMLKIKAETEPSCAAALVKLQSLRSGLRPD